MKIRIHRSNMAGALGSVRRGKAGKLRELLEMVAAAPE
jgi:hypothetical protein